MMRLSYLSSLRSRNPEKYPFFSLSPGLIQRLITMLVTCSEILGALDFVPVASYKRRRIGLAFVGANFHYMKL